jgi:hypothetical protein
LRRPRSDAPTTRDSLKVRPVRRPVTAEAFFTLGRAGGWTCFFRPFREK